MCRSTNRQFGLSPRLSVRLNTLLRLLLLSALQPPSAFTLYLPTFLRVSVSPSLLPRLRSSSLSLVSRSLADQRSLIVLRVLEGGTSRTG